MFNSFNIWNVQQKSGTPLQFNNGPNIPDLILLWS